MTTKTDTAGAVTAQLLGAGISRERILLPGPGFEAATALWNKGVAREPALVVRCQSPQEVQAAVRVATGAGLPLSVRGGGHDWTGRALRNGGLVIDLTLMRSVEVEGDVAVAQGGATNLDVVTAAEQAGMAVAAGNVGAVGFAGLATGGGYGPYISRFGLAADNLLGAEVVLADGRHVTADAAHEPELLWALKGGGGNFGVVVSLRVRLHPRTPFVSGLIAFPFAQVRDVLRGYAELMADAPDELSADAGVFTTPDGSPVVFVAPTWSGDPASGDVTPDHIAALGTPVLNTVADTTHSAVLRGNDELFSVRDNWAWGVRSLLELTPGAIDALVQIAETRTSPQSTIYWHQLRGAAGRVQPDAAAFGVRRGHFMIELIARWSDGGEAAPHHGWVRGGVNALEPHALPGGYANMLSDDEHDQIAHAYGPNAARLGAAKAHYDPDRVFAAIPLPEKARATSSTVTKEDSYDPGDRS